MEKFDYEHATAALSLAIRYHAYQRAFFTDDAEGVLVWGTMLAETQNAIGVYIEDPDHIRQSINIMATRAVSARMAEMEAHEGFEHWPADELIIKGLAADRVREGYSVDTAIDDACAHLALEAEA